MDKNKIIVYIPVYNDFTSFHRAYDSCKELGLQVMVGDGRFKYDDREFPQINNADMSTDELAFFCEKHSDIDYFYHAPCPENEKLNYAMNRAYEQGYKMFLMIGADAYLTGDIDDFVMNLNREVEKLPLEPKILRLRFKEHRPTQKWNFSGKLSTMTRVFVNYHLMEARNLHWLMYPKNNKDDTAYIEPEQTLIDGITLHHDNKIRPEERDILMTLYQDQNVVKERKIFYELCIPRWFKDIEIQFWIEGACSWEAKRKEFLKNKRSTHLLIAPNGADLLGLSYKLETLIKKYNNEFEHLSVISSVTPISKDKFVIRHGVKTDKLPTESLKKMYTGYDFKDAKDIYAVPWTPGYMICMERQVVNDIEHFGELDDFVMFCNQLGHMIYVAPELQVNENGSE